MLRWLSSFLALSLASLSSPLARFVRLPAGYYVTANDNPAATFIASSLLKCSVQATIRELAASNVTHYSFNESSEGFCKIYTSFDYIEKTNASRDESSAWFLKIPDNVTYDGSCDKQDVEGLAKYLNTTRSTLGLTSAPPSTKRPTSKATTRSTSKTTIRTTPRTTARTTPRPKPCAATKPTTQARIFLDYSSVMELRNESTKVEVECVCNGNTTLKQQFWSGATSPTSGASFVLTCTEKASLCIVPQEGSPWVPTGVPPDGIRVYPYCDSTNGCHMYVRHFTGEFLDTPTDLVNGWLGAELVQSGGARINEARYYENPHNRRPFEMPQRPRSYTSDVHIKAAAISCGGCQSVRNYASFTCPMPPAKG